ncbi:MAG: hypothetical protein K1X72_16615 [Pyrinomonadaceae bacterium]|nr:hypothetical protein [Pyrinomonadaceae bacterium]
MTASDSLIKIGDSITFSVSVEGIDNQKLKFLWTTSNGTIVSGQTAKITIATTPEMAGMTIRATVEIMGLPQDCQNIASFFGAIEKELPACVGKPFKMDEIYKSSWRDEKPRLQNVAYQFQPDEDSVIVIVISAPQNDKTGFIKNRSERFRKFLTKVSKIPKDKIKILSREQKDYVIEFYFVLLNSFDAFQDGIKSTSVSSSPQSQSKRRKGN